MLENIFKKKLKKYNRNVIFLDAKEVRDLVSPLTARAFEIFGNLIDRYVDYQMKEHVKNKINGEGVDENLEIKLRGVLEFKEFFDKLQGKE